jgi:hypothetical protein
MAKLKEDVTKAKEKKEQLDDENKSLKTQLMAKPSSKPLMCNKQILTEGLKDEPIKKRKPKQVEDELNTLRKEQKKYLADLSVALDGIKHKDRSMRVMVFFDIGVSFYCDCRDSASGRLIIYESDIRVRVE